MPKTSSPSPQLKYARALAIIASLAAAAASYLQNFSPESLLLAGATVVGALLLMLLIVLFAEAARSGSPVLRIPAIVMTWLAVIAATITTAMILVSAGLLIAERFKDPIDEPEPNVISKPDSTLDDIPTANKSAPAKKSSWRGSGTIRLVRLDQPADADQIRAQYFRLGSVTLLKTTMTIPADPNPQGPLVLSFYTFRMQQAKILTNGRDIEIRAVKFVVDNGEILANTGPATGLVQGTLNGVAGRDGGHVLLAALDEYRGKLTVTLSGQAGAPGGKGVTGAAGDPGGRGADAVQGVFDCRSGGQDGGAGGKGKTGGTGGNGGNGGNGGSLDTEWVATEMIASITFTKAGGPGGLAGPGGDGGPGGTGGAGGSGAGLCRGGHGGSQGPGGDGGAPGVAGASGAPGPEANQRRTRI
jgi:hypothetical protein